VSARFLRKAHDQLLFQSTIALRTVHKSDPVIFHAKLELIVLQSLKADANTSSTTVGECVLNRV